MKTTLLAFAALFLTQTIALNLGIAYDYIVIGGGVSGSTVAYVLGEDGNKKVLVLERGQDESGNFDTFPRQESPLGLWPFIENYPISTIDSREDIFVFPRTLRMYQGKALGGGAAVNGGAWIPMANETYEEWVNDYDLDSDIWGSAAQRPCNDWVENFADPYNPSEQFPLRGTQGPIEIRKTDENRAVIQIFNDAMVNVLQDVNIEYNRDIGDGSLEGFGAFQRNIGFQINCTGQGFPCPQRYHPWESLLKPLLTTNNNIDVVAGATVTKLEMNSNKRVNRVRYIAEGRSEVAYVKLGGKVILSAGHQRTPQILQLSGIGDCDALALLDIECEIDLPAVGQNFKDHSVVVFQYAAPGVLPDEDTPIMSAFLRSPYGNDTIDVELAYAGLATGQGFGGLLITAVNLRQDSSSGAVSLKYANPLDDPTVTTGYNWASSTLDGLRMRWIVDKTREFVGNVSVPFGGVLIELEPAAKLPDSSAVGAVGTAYWHGVGTAHVGTGGVLEDDGLLSGSQNLYVIDSSTLPNLPPSHPAATLTAMSLKLASLIYPANAKC